MHITLEADYALRIVDTLARQKARVDAKAIAETSAVPLRFSLKILRKLVAAGIVKSFKGAQGGFELAKSPAEITVYDVFETIEGPAALNRCLLNEGRSCNRNAAGKCPYHELFRRVSEQLKNEFSAVTFGDVAAGN